MISEIMKMLALTYIGDVVLQKRDGRRMSVIEDG